MERSRWGRAVVTGVAAGLALAAGLAGFVTIWEVIENPGGIFLTEDGWRWDFVGETAASWFLPTLPPMVLGATGLTLAVAWWRGRGA